MPPKTSPSPPPQERGELNVDLLVDKLRHMSHLSTITENRYVISRKKKSIFFVLWYDFLQSRMFSVPTQLTWDQEEIHIIHQPKVILQKKNDFNVCLHWWFFFVLFQGYSILLKKKRLQQILWQLSRKRLKKNGMLVWRKIQWRPTRVRRPYQVYQSHVQIRRKYTYIFKKNRCVDFHENL